jgi:hypothetical protein
MLSLLYGRRAARNRAKRAIETMKGKFTKLVVVLELHSGSVAEIALKP